MQAAAAAASAALAVAAPSYLVVPFLQWQPAGADGLGLIANALLLLHVLGIVGALEGASLLIAQWAHPRHARLPLLAAAFACTGAGTLANASFVLHALMVGAAAQPVLSPLPAHAAVHLAAFLLSLGGFLAAPGLLHARTSHAPSA